MGAIFTQILVGNGRGQVTGCRAQGAETRDGRGKMEAKTGASCRVQVAGEARDTIEDGSGEMEAKTVASYRAQGTSSRIQPWTLHPEP
jgi:hypothetical protein